MLYAEGGEVDAAARRRGHAAAGVTAYKISRHAAVTPASIRRRPWATMPPLAVYAIVYAGWRSCQQRHNARGATQRGAAPSRMARYRAYGEQHGATLRQHYARTPIRAQDARRSTPFRRHAAAAVLFRHAARERDIIAISSRRAS